MLHTSHPLAGALAAGFAVAAVFQPTARAQADFKVQSELVVLHVTVKDRNGAFVPDLNQDAFRVFEDKQPRAIKFFAPEDAPVTVGLVIDSSGSMAGVRDLVIAASTAFVESSNPEDEVFAIVFNDTVRPVSSLFTSNPTTLRSALTDLFRPSGRTALYDAIALGLTSAAKGTRQRQVLVVLSDGGDNASRLTFADALSRTESSNTVIYTVALVDPTDSSANPKRLKELAEATGGSAFAPNDVAHVVRVFQQIADEIRHGYTIGYEAADGQKAGFRHVRVEAQSPTGRQFRTRTRTGYMGRAGGLNDAP